MSIDLTAFNFDNMLALGLGAIIETKGNIQEARVKIYSRLKSDYERAERLGRDHGYQFPTNYGNETEAALFLGRVAYSIREGGQQADLKRKFLTHTYNLEQSPSSTDEERVESRLEREAKTAIIELAFQPENLKEIMSFSN
jgi:hypothetical protein